MSRSAARLSTVNREYSVKMNKMKESPPATLVKMEVENGRVRIGASQKATKRVKTTVPVKKAQRPSYQRRGLERGSENASPSPREKLRRQLKKRSARGKNGGNRGQRDSASSGEGGDLQIVLGDEEGREDGCAIGEASVETNSPPTWPSESSQMSSRETNSRNVVFESVVKREPGATDKVEEPFFENQPSLVECLGLPRKRNIIKLNILGKSVSKGKSNLSLLARAYSEVVIKLTSALLLVKAPARAEAGAEEDLAASLAAARAELEELRARLSVEKSLNGDGRMKANPYDEAARSRGWPETGALLDIRDGINHSSVKDFFREVMGLVQNRGIHLEKKSVEELVRFRDSLRSAARQAEERRRHCVPEDSRYEKIDLKLLSSAEGILRGYLQKVEDVLFQPLPPPTPTTPKRIPIKMISGFSHYDIVDIRPKFREVEETIFEKGRGKIRVKLAYDVIAESRFDQKGDDPSLKVSPSSEEQDRPYSPSDRVYKLEHLNSPEKGADPVLGGTSSGQPDDVTSASRGGRPSPIDNPRGANRSSHATSYWPTYLRSGAVYGDEASLQPILSNQFFSSSYPGPSPPPLPM